MMTKKQLRRLYNVCFLVIGLALAYPVFNSSKSALDSIRRDLQQKYDNNRKDEFYRERNELIHAGKQQEANELIPPWGTIDHPFFATVPPSVAFIHEYFIALSLLVFSAFYLLLYFIVFYSIVVISKIFRWTCSYVKGD
jgi:hypothetical protein